MMQASVLLMCGLPGSGKTTIVSRIFHYYEQQSRKISEGTDDLNAEDCSLADDKDSLMFDHIVKIDYDKIAINLAEKTSKRSDEKSNDSCKTVTAEDTTKDSNRDGEIQNNEMTFTSHDLEAWKESRTVALQMIQQELQNAMNFTDSSSHGSNGKARKILILLDDNFHLRSMRNNIYKCCQNFISSYTMPNNSSNNDNIQDIHIGMSILHVVTSLSTCLERNEQRLHTKQYVPKHIIEKMSQTLEAPDPSKAKFECCTLQFELDHMDMSTKKVQRDGSKSSPYIPSSLLHELHQNLNKCLKDAITLHSIQPPPSTKTEEELQQERQATLQSRSHRLDRMLRVLVRCICQSNSSLAKVANKSRKEILQEYKRMNYAVDIEKEDYSSVDDDSEGTEYSSFALADRLDQFVLKRFYDNLKLSIQEGKSRCALRDIESIIHDGYTNFLSEWNKSVKI